MIEEQSVSAFGSDGSNLEEIELSWRIIEEEAEDCDCSECDEDFDEANYDIALDEWGVNRNLNLENSAADFYLLYDLSLDGYCNDEFNDLLTTLVTQFTAYTDLAVGGELRHTISKYRYSLEGVLGTEDGLSLITPCGSREGAWRAWRDLRETYGAAVLREAIDAFNLQSISNGYGGPSWARIAKLLLQYVEGKISPLMFIDSCWGLEHNGGCYFSKVWYKFANLKEILDANLRGDTAFLLKHATQDVRHAYLGHKIEGGI